MLLSDATGQTHKLRDHLIERGFEVELLSISENPNWLYQVIASPPGAVVLDYQPTAEQGWELMKRMRENPATREIPVVFYSISEAQARGTLLEMDYLTKPLSNIALLDALQHLGLDPVSDQRTLLIVDDELQILELHVRMLAKELPGYRILTAHNGLDALQVMEHNQPDLVLLDLMMPEMDGFELLAAMRDQKSTRQIPVIVLTAQILSHEDMARLQSGVAAVLDKDLFSEAEVMQQVESALARSRRLGTEAQRIVRQAMAFIHQHYSDDCSRSRLAEALCISENYLGRCFNQEMGITPTSYLNRYRVRQARKLFDSGEVNITEVANRVGYADSNYFGRVFRREVGVPPSAYLRGERTKTSRSKDL